MQRIAILYDASQAVLSTFRLDEVLERILAIARDYFHLHHAAVLLLDEERQELYFRSESDGRGDKVARRIPVGQGLVGTAARQKRPIYAPDVSKDARYVPGNPATRSEVALPLIVRDKVVGILDCQSDLLNFFDGDKVDLLTIFATQASIAIQNAQLYELERRRAAQLEAINSIARVTANLLDINELLDKACTLVRTAFHVDHVSILLTGQDNALVLRAHAGTLAPRVAQQAAVRAGAGLYGDALSSGMAFVDNDLPEELDAEAAGRKLALCCGARSEACLPLTALRRRQGVLVLDSAHRGAFDNSDLPPLQSVADICAQAIQNADYFEQVRQLAYLDGLTSVFNRRYFESRILEEIARTQRYAVPISVLMIDVDQFKLLNDEFGHLLGDEILRRLSALFVQHLRRSDIVCRFGGDEFAVLLPEIDAAHAESVAHKLHQQAREMEVPGVARAITISVGVSSCPEHGTTRDVLIKAADAALYAAKQGGRNCVVVAPLLHHAQV